MTARKIIMRSKKSLGYWISNRQIAPPTLTYSMHAACRDFFTLPSNSLGTSLKAATTPAVSPPRQNTISSSDKGASAPSKASDSYYSRPRSGIHQSAPNRISAQNRPKPSGRVRGFSTGLDEDHPVVEWWQDNLDDEIVMVDVREAAELHDGGVPGAINLPLSELQARYSELGDKQTPLAVFCVAGIRSQQAINFLQSIGYNNMANTHSPGFQKALLEQFPPGKKANGSR